jgi:hypothetical protein
MNVTEMVAESLRIEGITRNPSEAEKTEFVRFVGRDKITINELKKFVEVYEPGAQLRNQVGLDVSVGDYLAPLGGPGVEQALESLLDFTCVSHDLSPSPWFIHTQYELLHPFTDCNGRSGRALWYWTMRGTPLFKLGFLHAFYYQTLQRNEL